MFNKFTLNAQKAIKSANNAAKKLKSNSLLLEHLFIGLITVKEGVASRLLSRLGLDPDETVKSIEKELSINLNNGEMSRNESSNETLDPTKFSDDELFSETQKSTQISGKISTEDILRMHSQSGNIDKKENTLQNDSEFNLTFTKEFKAILEISFDKAVEGGHTYVGTEHILLAMLTLKDYPFVQELAKLNIDLKRISKELKEFAQYPEPINEGEEYAFEKNNPFDNPMLDARLRSRDILGMRKSEKGSTLSTLGINLTQMAREGKLDPVIGRKDEISRIMQVISRRTKNNPILLGDAGVGKTAIVEGLAQNIAFGDVSPVLSGFEVWSIDTASIIAGSQLRGDMESKVFDLIKEVQEKRNIILFIDEIHTLVGAGSTGQSSLDVANILKPALARGSLRCIGATTVEEYRKSFDTDPALQRRFQPIDVDEISEEDSLEVLRQIKPIYESYHNVKISESAITASVRLSVRYIKDRYLPDKAIDLIDEACSRNKLNRIQLTDDFKSTLQNLSKIVDKKNAALNSKRLDEASALLDKEREMLDLLKQKEDSMKQKWERNGKVITDKDILKVVHAWTKIPIPSLETDSATEVKKMEKALKDAIIGQDYAVNQVINSIKRSKAGISGTEKPLASFLFVGPTGVGKTELALQLAKSMFGSKDALIQVDMSELMEGHSVSKLVGAPPGYIGYDNGGQLTAKVRRNPFSVILFDEIEKASPDVLNILLQVLDKGVLTDSKGKKVDFKNTIIIMTSNIGTKELSKGNKIGISLSSFENLEENSKHEMLEIEQKIKDALKEYLSPEFLNRIDEIIVFRQLTEPDIKAIARLQFRKFLEQVEKNYNLTFEVENEQKIVNHIVKIGYSEAYGAREIARALRNTLENEIAENILKIKPSLTTNIGKKIVMNLKFVKNSLVVKLNK